MLSCTQQLFPLLSAIFFFLSFPHINFHYPRYLNKNFRVLANGYY
nr:MAG TPA: hypothetical protein [Caudoviricetes sp.]